MNIFIRIEVFKENDVYVAWGSMPRVQFQRGLLHNQK